MDRIYKCLTKRLSDLFGRAMVIVFAFAPVKGNISFVCGLICIVNKVLCFSACVLLSC